VKRVSDLIADINAATLVQKTGIEQCGAVTQRDQATTTNAASIHKRLQQQKRSVASQAISSAASIFRLGE
jgi:hypothetical protein